MTIVDKVISLLIKNGQMSLSDIYDSLPEHPKASIRGNINRYVKKDNAQIKRVEKGVYCCIEIIHVSEINEGKDGKKSVSYSANYYYQDKSVHFFHRDYITDDENIVEGVFSNKTSFDTLEEMQNHQDSLQAVLINGDARDVLSRLKDNSFDLLVTDPPYRTISGGRGGKNAPSGILSKNDGKIFDFNDTDIEDWIYEVYRVMKDGSQGYIFTNVLNLSRYMRKVEEAGFKIHNVLCWEKNNATPNRWYMNNREFVLFIYKGKAHPIKDCGSKACHKFDNIIGNKFHETEKPLDLLRMYISNSTTGGWCLDPFAGSGATLVASLLEGVKCFTCEIDNKYILPIIGRVNSIYTTGKDLKREELWKIILKLLLI